MKKNNRVIVKVKTHHNPKHKSSGKLSKVSPEIEKAKSIARFYGFAELPHIEITKEDLHLSKRFTESHLKSIHPWKSDKDRFGGFLEEKISLIRNFSEKTFSSMPQPVMGFYEGPIKGNPHMGKRVGEETFNLEVVGSSKSVVDATVIETAFVLLKDRYPGENFYVEINSIGDKESTSRFTRELQNYCNKEGGKMSKSCRKFLKKDLFSLFCCKHNTCKEVQEMAPKPMSFLSEASRTHFKEVLEYIESIKIPYEINHHLIGSRSFCNETIFEIKTKNGDEETIYAIGERYNGLARKVWGKKDIPAIGISLLMHPHFVLRRKVQKEKSKETKFYFIQFGFDAKLKSLPLIEILRKADIGVEQSLSKDKLTIQLASAEKMNVPYVLIMGQKEAMENSVVVRNMNNRSQETVLIDDLVKYLKKLK